MRTIVVGMGVQGQKRKLVAGETCVATVDTVAADVDFRRLQDVPLDSFDAALLCIPDGPKVEQLDYLMFNRKHVLVEKPLWAAEDSQIEALQRIARSHGTVCYTAYNHRFEPHFIRMREIIKSGDLGEIYSCRLFYGNGTARLVRNSEWRDHGSGVLHDLGSHLLDTVAFWFGALKDAGFKVISSNCFENRSPDHVVFGTNKVLPRLELEMTLLMWRNHFTCDIIAEKGTAHIESLCKWGPSSFRLRTRVLPSGRPPEETVTLVMDDPTWEAEWLHFQGLCARNTITDLSTDLWLNRLLRQLGDQAISSSREGRT